MVSLTAHDLVPRAHVVYKGSTVSAFHSVLAELGVEPGATVDAETVLRVIDLSVATVRARMDAMSKGKVPAVLGHLVHAMADQLEADLASAYAEVDKT